MKIDLKNKYINYFVSKGHTKMESASVVPENDPSSLFVTAGMQPLVPYLLGAPHPLGKRITDYQKCFRLTDIESVGDKTHHTFFEMLGNWSLGDYFKKEAVAWSYEFLTQVLSIPPERLAVTVFEGNDVVPRDEETAQLWQQVGIPGRPDCLSARRRITGGPLLSSTARAVLIPKFSIGATTVNPPRRNTTV